MKTPSEDLTKNDGETAEEMNRAFNGVYVRETQTDELPTPNREYNGDVKSNIILNRNKLMKKMKKLKTGKAYGPDGVSPYVLNKCAELLCDPLFDIFQSSLTTGDVPFDWRLATISAIFKRGSRSDPLNYRPVSLTSVVSKLLESLIRDELIQHVEENNILVNAQHGFRNNRSCLTNMLQYLESFANSYDKGNPVDVQYLDCEKAFDRVPHQRLFVETGILGHTRIAVKLDKKLLEWKTA